MTEDSDFNPILQILMNICLLFVIVPIVVLFWVAFSIFMCIIYLPITYLKQRIKNGTQSSQRVNIPKG